MRTPRATVVAALAGAVALASAAYGIGTQTGDGTASARDDPRRSGDEPGRFELRVFSFDDLAEELGVDAEELQDALADFHEQREGERSDAFAAALAEALDKPVGEVEAALDEIRPRDGMRGPCGPHVSLRRLASALDVSRAELRKALREVRAGADSAWEDRREDLVKFLAERFGLSESEVEEALPDLPGPVPHGIPGPPPPGWGDGPG
jgi:hypothetical protein